MCVSAICVLLLRSFIFIIPFKAIEDATPVARLPICPATKATVTLISPGGGVTEGVAVVEDVMDRIGRGLCHRRRQT